MRVASVSNVLPNFISGVGKDESIDQDYAALIEQFYPAQEHRTRDEINAEDTVLAQFKDDLTTKGAALFLKELNEEKIEALIEEYRQKLLKEQADNPDIPMDINQMVSDFKKQLLEEMMEAQKADQKNQPIQSAALMSQDILENSKMVRNDEQKSGLPEVGFLEQMLSASNTEAKRKSSEV